MESKTEGKASTFKRQLIRRFGVLTWAEARIAVDGLADRRHGIFDATSAVGLIGREN